LDYPQRLEYLGLKTLPIRRVKYDLLMCYEIIISEVSFHCNLLDLSDFNTNCTSITPINVNAYMYFFSLTVLPNTVVEASSLHTFKRLLDSADLCQFAVLPYFLKIICVLFRVLRAYIKWPCGTVCSVRIFFLIKL